MEKNSAKLNICAGADARASSISSNMSSNLDQEETQHCLVRVLMVEDDPAYRIFVRRILVHDSQAMFEFIGVSNLCECQKFLAEQLVDVILLDLSLPDSAGMSTIRTVSEMCFGAPIIVLTARDYSNLGLIAIGLGAQDYLVKHRISNDGLVRCIRYAIERKKYEESKIRLAAIKGFISTLAHDLQVPLVGANNVLDALIEGSFGPLECELHGVLRSLKKSNEFQLKVVQKLLELYKYELDSPTLVFESLDLKELLSSCVLRHSSAEQIINTQVPRDLPRIMGDRLALIRLLDNLLDNAVKYGAVDSPISINIEADRQSISIFIHNFGKAIPEELRTGIFEHFWQGVPGKSYVAQTGIGLYLCHRIATLHKGRLTCQSDDQEGTTMIVRLPAGRAADN